MNVVVSLSTALCPLLVDGSTAIATPNHTNHQSELNSTVELETTKPDTRIPSVIPTIHSEPNLKNESAPEDGNASTLPDWVADFNYGCVSVYLLQKTIGFCANLLTIIAIAKYEKLSEHPSNIFIGNLAVADCINFLSFPSAIILYFPLLNREKSSHQTVWIASCYAGAVFNVVSFYGNFCHIFVIGIERILSHFPLFMKANMSTGKAKITCAILWSLIEVKLGVDFIFFNNGLDFPVCVWRSVFSPGVYIYSINAPFLAISCVTLLLYLKIGHIAYRNAQRHMVRLNFFFVRVWLVFCGHL